MRIVLGRGARWSRPERGRHRPASAAAAAAAFLPVARTGTRLGPLHKRTLRTYLPPRTRSIGGAAGMAVCTSDSEALEPGGPSPSRPGQGPGSGGEGTTRGGQWVCLRSFQDMFDEGWGGVYRMDGGGLSRMAVSSSAKCFVTLPTNR